MQMHVKDFLTAFGTNVASELVAFELQTVGDFFRIPDEVAHEFLVAFFHALDGVNMLLRDDQHVVLGLGIDIIKPHGF